VIDLAGEKRDAKLKIALEDQVRLVRFEVGRIELNLLPTAPPTLVTDLAEKLTRWTGQRWTVAISRKPAERPIGEVRREREAAELAEIKSHPAVKAVMSSFPDAEIRDVRPLQRPGSIRRFSEDD
jgi:DNA polymerase III subunit gamma/tau